MDSDADYVLSLRGEREWVEFKTNNADPEMIGQAASALANSAALNRRECGFLVWGIDDATCEFVGTNFTPSASRRGAEPLEPWLVRLLSPRLNIRFCAERIGDKSLVVMRVPAAMNMPVRFSGCEYVRVGTTTRKLADYPEKERELWRTFRQEAFESSAATGALSPSEVLGLLDSSEFFRLLGRSTPDTVEGAMSSLADAGVLLAYGDRYAISNLGAILFAADFTKFPLLSRRRPRVIVYSGRNRTSPVRETEGKLGYALAFPRLHRHVMLQLPANEHIREAVRATVPVYPEIAVRELIANALIHQDLTVAGAGPMIEIFEDRIEVSNPGDPLVEPHRFIDASPRSRNDRLGEACRRLGFCEERGSGIDKVVSDVELFQLPPPEFSARQGSTIVTLYAPRELSHLSRDEKLRACYQHACLQFVTGQPMTNSTLRKRLGIGDRNYATASRILSDAVGEGLVKRRDPLSDSKRYAEYVPHWA